MFSRIREIGKKYFGHLFITSSSFRFFNKTDFEQYLYLGMQYGKTLASKQDVDISL